MVLAQKWIELLSLSEKETIEKLTKISEQQKQKIDS